MSSPSSGITLRPYHLLCAVCALGEDDPGAIDPAIRDLLEAVRQAPDTPVTLRCQAGDIFAYQNSGTTDDTPEGAEFNVRRDLEILHKLNLFPGATLPARMLFYRLLAQIEDVAGICGYDAVTADAWRGCPKAHSGCYARGHARGIEAIIPPRAKEEMAAEQADSLAAMRRADAVCSRPHMLLCAVCQYGSGVRPPFAEDNLPDLIAMILRQPDTPIMMAPGADWMMCGPCPYRAAGLNACVNNRGAGGLSNQMRDLRVMQKLGLVYGEALPARELYRRIFDRIAGTLEICRLDHVHPSVWYTGCGAATADSEAFAQGKEQFMQALHLVRDLTGNIIFEEEGR